MNVAGPPSRDVSVVIPARNAAATISGTLRSLAPDRDLIGEVLLIDDGSEDGTAAAASESAARQELPLRVVAMRLGSAGAARNAGIDLAGGKYIFFLDADDEVMPGSLKRLRDALLDRAGAGLAIGASIRRTEGRPDKLKAPHGYSDDRAGNVRAYLRNQLWPIAMGSALIVATATQGIRFPEAIGLDEDTCYWAALLARADPVTVPAPVLLYHHDEARMTRRFLIEPRRTFLAIALELNRLVELGVPRDAVQWRKAWIAQRIARQLIKHRFYADAAGMMRAVRAHQAFARTWRSRRYLALIRLGRLARSAGKTQPPSGRDRRTLIVCYDPAFPPTSGADLRNHRNAIAASQFGAVHLVSIRPRTGVEQPRDTRIRVGALTVEGEPRSASIGWWRTSVEKRIARSALTRLEALVRSFRPDTIVVEGIALFKLLAPLRPLARQLILDMHNVESHLAAQPGEDTRSEPAATADVAAYKRLERRAMKLVDRIWVCSGQDRDRLAALPPSDVPIDVVPNGIPRMEDIPPELPTPPPETNGFPVIIFVGHLGYQPNIEAAERLARRILPRIRAALPRARLILAGRYPKPAVRALSDLDGVQLIDSPADMASLLCGAHLSIIPLSMGGGTRIKILEAMAWGVPVIATPLAAEGLDLIDGEEMLLAETDADLAAKAVALCLDPDRLRRQRMAAHDAAWSRFGPAALRDAVRSGLGLAEASRPPVPPMSHQ